MAEQPIYTDQPGALPASYKLPPGLDLGLHSIVARIDGSAAAGSFLPTLSVYTSDGKLIARVPSDVTYAVGDTGVVTWSPFLARRVSTPTPSTSGPQCAYIAWTNGGNIADSTYTTLASLSNLNWFTYTNDASVFSFDTNNGQILIGANGGFYIAQLQLAWGADIAANVMVEIAWAPNLKEWFGGFTEGNVYPRIDPSQWTVSHMSAGFVENSGGNRWITGAFEQFSGGTRFLNSLVLKVIRLTDGWP